MSFLETEYTSHHDSKCFGFFLRYHRKKQNLSLNYFAAVSYTHLDVYKRQHIHHHIH